ncbi:MAG TPA: restriction endonuclease subunit S [Methanobrevibacter smithii]|nr:restriction endonuclease subunit S [Methanobrevibacter smithii]HJI98767.1 restriction endonuclease subunit S [Methanobrevibacter smithii]
MHNKSSSISINQLDDNVGNYPLYGASGFLKCIDFYEMDSDYISIVKDGSGVGNISFHEKNTSVVNTSQYILPKENLNIHFIFYLLQTINLNKYKTGSTIPHIYFKDYSIEKVKIPKYDEQKKIGILLKNLDAKIEILDNKLQMCQNFKKYLMQQIFTQKLRFTDYIKEWKTIKLKDVGEINTGNTPSTKVNEYYSPKKYLWVTPSDISSKYIFDTAKRLSDEGAKKGRFVKKNSVLVTCIASIGKNCIILEDGYFNQQINSITPSQSFDLDFIYYLIDYNSEKMKNYAGITATPILNKKSFENMKFEFPSFDEQKQISNMLSNIDNKIFAIEELINKTQKFKKGLLQQMFIVRINWRCNFKLAKSPSFNKHLLILKNKIIFIIIE